MIEQIIYLLLTVFIPLKLSYSSYRHSNTENQKLLAMYWAIYFAFKSVQWDCWLLQYRPVDFVFVLLALWLYNDSYKVYACDILGWALPSWFVDSIDWENTSCSQYTEYDVKIMLFLEARKLSSSHFLREAP